MAASRLCALVGTLLVSGLALAEQPKNLLANGDAEEGPIGQSPPHWTHSGYDGVGYPRDFIFDTCTPGRAGQQAIRLERPPRLAWTYGEQRVPIRLDADRRYVLSLWIRSDKPLPKGVDLALLTASPPGAGELPLPESRRRIDVDTQWRQHSLAVVTYQTADRAGKPLEAGLRVLVQVYGAGTVYFDDASLIQQPLSAAEKAEATMAREIYRQGVPGFKSPIGVRGGMVALGDRNLLAFTDDFSMSRSQDGGRTWGPQQPLAIDDKADTGPLSGALLTREGTLLIWTEPIYLWRSTDGGRTWSKRSQIGPSGRPLHGNLMIETSGGRLVIPVREANTVHQGLWKDAGAFGTVSGQRVIVEGHAHAMEMDVSFVYYSTNAGQSWRRSEGQIIIWKDDGYGGMWPCDEPNVVELKDGRLLMFLRTTLGRIYQTTSSDGGQTWAYPEPTELPASYSPCSLKRIPRTGDLLCVWNNVSAEEIRRGLRRGRLSTAISKDDGRTWTNVKTLDAAGVPPLKGTAPLSPPAMVRAEKNLGELPVGFGLVHYPDVVFAGDQVIVKYAKKILKPPVEIGNRLQILPLDWFYKP